MWPSIVDDVGEVAVDDDEHGQGIPGLHDRPYAGVHVVIGYSLQASFCPHRRRLLYAGVVLPSSSMGFLTLARFCPRRHGGSTHGGGVKTLGVGSTRWRWGPHFGGTRSAFMWLDTLAVGLWLLWGCPT